GLGNAAALAAQFFGGNPWWRGHSISTWKLCPSVFRVEDAGDNYESNIAQHFMLGARARYPDCPDIKDAASWLFLMQHYGLPTRLLDWTKSILIATYFAVRDEEHHNQDGAVWAIVGSLLNEAQVGNRMFLAPTNEHASNLFHEVYGEAPREPSNKIVATNSFQSDIRMMVQLSEFTLHGVATPIEELPNRDKFLMRFTIPWAAKSDLKSLLGAFGITESTIFPDLEHLAKDLRMLRFKS
ncbi:MAG: FRG domain-containing protein, partial [Rhodospirillales bacterium]|nr:FRG domain-containing protein [Rhodospirillales bacterium]